MNSRRSTTQALISVKAAIVLAVIAGAGGLLAYEWHHAHSATAYHANSGHHHHKPHKAKAETH